MHISCCRIVCKKPNKCPCNSENRELSDLFRRENGDVVLVDDPGRLLYRALVCLFPEVVAGQPKEHVLLAELRPEKLSEGVPPCWTAHQLVERLPPGTHLLQRGLGAAMNTGTMGVSNFPLCIFGSSLLRLSQLTSLHSPRFLP